MYSFPAASSWYICNALYDFQKIKNALYSAVLFFFEIWTKSSNQMENFPLIIWC